MAGKRKRDGALTTTLHSSQDNTTNPLPQRWRKKQDAPTDTTYTISQILAFKDGISKTKDWTSPTGSPKHVQVIYWFDVDGLTKAECAERYPNRDGKPCSATNVFKVYNTYAPRFYAERGLTYVPLGKRGIPRAQVTDAVVPLQRKTRVGGRKGTRKVSIVDRELKRLFGKLPEPKSATSLVVSHNSDTRVSAQCSRLATPEGTDDLVPKYDVFTFICKVDFTRHGSPTGPCVERACLVRHCNTIRDALLENPNVRALHYGPEISIDTVSRFVACISPTLQPHLLMYVTTQFGTFEQEWTLSDLEDLYVFAVIMGAQEVCDLVMDQWVEELRRPEPRMIRNEHGEVEVFDLLGFGPEFLGFLHANDEQGFKFFLSVLVTHGSAGWALLCDTCLGNWHEDVKKALIETIQEGRAVDLVAASREIVCVKFHHHGSEAGWRCYKCPALGTPLPPKTKEARPAQAPTPWTRNLRRFCDDVGLDEDGDDDILQLTVPGFLCVHDRHPRDDDIDSDLVYSRACTIDRLRQHRNDYIDERMRYANPKFNAHHDTVEVCEQKLRMVREKLALFKEKGIKLSEEEVDKALGVSEDPGGVEEDEDEDGEDEDGDEEEFEVL